MAPALTIRNVTSTAVEITVIERFEPPERYRTKNPLKVVGRVTANATNTITSIVGVQTLPQRRMLPEDAKGYTQEGVSIRIEPFRSVRTNERATHGSPDILRLVLEIEGQKYRTNTMSNKSSSVEFTPLDSNPHFELTGVFVPQENHLSIYSSAGLSTWMSMHADTIPLSLLSIPGTHNSPTYHKALPSVRCQAVPLREQLNNGVRFFDIRVQPEHHSDPAKDRLKLVHGVFPISLTGAKYFRDVLHDVEAFLATHPSETVIISLKREGPGEATDEHLSKILHQHYAHDLQRWWTEPRIPTLGEVRRKIVLLRRFSLHDDLKGLHEGRGWGLNAENWADNTPCNTTGDICVQDFYQVLETKSIEAKIRYSQEHLDRSCLLSCSPFLSEKAGETKPSPPPLHLNFLSASNFWKQDCWPEKIAAKLNPAIRRYLCVKHATQIERGQGDGCTGVVIMDWAGENGDWDLVRCVVGMNARLLIMQRT